MVLIGKICEVTEGRRGNLMNEIHSMEFAASRLCEAEL
jgi:hypothetical protein